MTGMYWLIALSCLILFSYLYTIRRLHSGWKKISPFPGHDQDTLIKVSVIIPFRNESGNILGNLRSLRDQDYPDQGYEVIYVNDHSYDQTCELLEQQIKGSDNIRLIHLNAYQFGKKDAVITGSTSATGDLLLFSDADCYPVRSWIKTMAGYYSRYKPVMLSGPVLMIDEGGMTGRLQSLEFMSLIGSGAGSFGLENPVLCNGANMGFNRKIYLDHINGIKKDISSGDDIFMLLSLKKNYVSRMKFLKSSDAVVYTHPSVSLGSFISQRMRWVSKSRHYNDFPIIITALSVLGINILIGGLSVLLLFRSGIFLILILLILMKWSVDFLFLRSVCTFFDKEKLLRLFIPAEVIYIPYSILTAIGGSILFPGWKDRKIKNG